MIFDEIYEKLSETIPPEEFKKHLSKADLITIFGLDKYVKPKSCVVELGTGSGTSAIMMALSWVASNIIIYSIDNGNTDGAKKLIKNLGLNSSIKLIQGNTREVDFNNPIDVLHVDGDSRYAAVIQDLIKWCPLVKSGGLILFHNYNSTNLGIVKAVDEWLSENAGSHISVKSTYKVVIKE